MGDKPKRKHPQTFIWKRTNTAIVFWSGIAIATIMFVLQGYRYLFLVEGIHDSTDLAIAFTIIASLVIGLLSTFSIPLYQRNGRNMLITVILTSIGTSMMTLLTLLGVTFIGICGLIFISPFYFFLTSIFSSIQQHGNKLYAHKKQKDSYK